MLIKAIDKELSAENSEEEIHVTKEYVSINGSTQGLIIESMDTTMPVLLFLHGFGFPAYPLIKANKVHLEKFFTVCYWDQRGAGMSYNPKEAKTPMTINQVIDDVIAVTQYLRKKVCCRESVLARSFMGKLYRKFGS
ncbi:MAG: alpha/beta hydrolase [Bacillus sp. (in: Bacteria)]|nr:alpha/beta hydrolase [Bacillus sp. (in: firmicutes)]